MSINSESNDLTIHTVDAEKLKALLEAGKAILVDVRENEEYKEEHILGSLHIPLSAFDISSFKPGNKTVIFHCRSGKRSHDAAKLYASLNQEDGYHLVGGIVAWKKMGFPTTLKP